MGDTVQQILVKLIQQADKVVKLADNSIYFRQECLEIKFKTEKLAGLLRQAAALANNGLHHRPARRIIDVTKQVLATALALVFKCRRVNRIRRVFIVVHAAALRRISTELVESVGDVSWLLRLSTPVDHRDDNEYLGMPPIASNEPILSLIWEQVAILCSGSIEERMDAANFLVSIARNNNRYAELVIEECGGAPPGLMSCVGRTWKVSNRS